MEGKIVDGDGREDDASDQYHPEIGDEQIREMVGAGAYDEDGGQSVPA